MNNPILQIKNVSMRFILSREKIDNFKDYLLKTIKKDIKYNDYYALKNVSFDVQKGDRVAILGLNGAGKSTLLKVIAGVYHPTEGTVVKNGKIIPLLELGAGFEKQYTGRENIFLYGAFLGYSKEFIESKLDEIIEFSELGKFIDMPIMNYSSGMRARLGFSIATIVQPEIIILDEVLSVGDVNFRQKSEKKIRSLMKDDVTVLFVSHNIGQVKNICNKAVILDKGRLMAYGEVDEICAQYVKMTRANKYPELNAVTNDLPAPELTIVLNEKGKPRLRWNKVQGAEKYQIFRSDTGEDFYYLATTVSTVATNSKTPSGATYYYKVRVVAADGSYSKFSEPCVVTVKGVEE
ncbi:MAG: ATP-binding cassette domain-containing protein [Oscillospiraceae bacterium]|nr:ATP-binding cassette domain-containing protein [Oscillospiraceae bacterium]